MENLEVLKTYYPQFFNEKNEFKFDKFKEELDKDNVEYENEGYNFSFVGKEFGKLFADADTETLLVPDLDNKEKKSNNHYLIGDNLEALKHLRKSYNEKIKLIYIDPPYNTGKKDDFTYNDKFEYTVKELTEIFGDEDKAIRTYNLQGKSSHSAWLTFMLPRIILSQKILKNDGTIFISIGQDESTNLKILMNEIFGEYNFIAEIPRLTKKSGKTTNLVAENHDLMLIYAKNRDLLTFNKLDFDTSSYNLKDEYYDSRGPYKLTQTLDYDSLQYGATMDYEIVMDEKIYVPGSDYNEFKERQRGFYNNYDWTWRWSKKKYEFGLKNGFISLKSSTNRIYTKTYLGATISEDEQGEYYIEIIDRKRSILSIEFVDNKYSNDVGKKDLTNLMGKSYFTNPKPLNLMKSIFDLIKFDEDDIILDYFSGSGSTAAALLEWLEKKDTNMNLNFILVQLPEALKENSLAFKHGYKTVDQIGIKRIEKTAEKIESKIIDKDFNKFYLISKQQDDLENIETIEEFEEVQTTMGLHSINEIYSYKGTEGTISLLYTWLVKDGFGLNPNITNVKINDYECYQCDEVLYIINENISSNDVKKLLEHIDNNLLVINNLIVYTPALSFTQMYELEMALKNRKTVKLEKRF